MPALRDDAGQTTITGQRYYLPWFYVRNYTIRRGGAFYPSTGAISTHRPWWPAGKYRIRWVSGTDAGTAGVRAGVA